MGGSSSTTTIIVQNEAPPPNPPCPPPPNFMQNMINWINNLIGPPISYTGDTGKDVQALTTQVYNYTSNQFSLNFNYPYMGNSSNPPNCSDTDLVYGMTDLVNCSGNSPQLITNYLSQNVIPNSSLPSDVQRNASSDLNRTVNNFLQGQTTGWQSTKYHRQYNAKDKSVWAVDADFVWTCVQAVDYSATNPSSSLVLFMNFLGTTYPVKNAPSS